MYHSSLNEALESQNLEMSINDVTAKIGSIGVNETKRFQHDNRQVSIYRMDSGKYEILSYKL